MSIAISQVLEEHPRPATQTIHIGCATWHNLDIMCARRSTYGLIVDFNPKNCEFIWKTIEIVNACNSRDEFKQAMNNYLNSLEGEERELFFHGDQRGLPTDRIEQELSRTGSWLHTDESYQYIKEQLVAQGRLISITEDITNFEQFSRIRSFLNSNNIAIDTLYMSNICNFMDTSSKRSLFARTVKNLINNDTLFINCPILRQPNGSNKTILHQQFALGKEILSPSYKSEYLFEKTFIVELVNDEFARVNKKE